MKFLNIIMAILVLMQGFLFNFNFVYAEEIPRVIINEVFWSGSSLSSVDEFIELYNTTDQDLDISDWIITEAGANNNELILPASSTIPALGFFVVANYSPDNEKSILDIEADWVTPSISLANSDARYILRDQNGTDIDQADDGEGEPLAGDNETKASMARKPDCWDGGAGECWFTSEIQENLKDDVLDFATPGADNGWEEPIINLAPVASITALATAEVNLEVVFDGSESFDPEDEDLNYLWFLDDEEAGTQEIFINTFLEPATHEITLLVDDGELQDSTSTQIVVFPEPELPYVPKKGDILINEFLPNPSGGSEWIEIVNMTSQTIEFIGWTIWDGKSKIYDLSDNIQANGFWLITLGSAKLNNSGDQIQIKYNDNVIDTITYGDWEDGDVSDNAPCPGQEHALARPERAQDSIFAITITPTPGEENIISALEEPEEEEAAEEAEEPVVVETVPVVEMQQEEVLPSFAAGALIINELVSDPPPGGVEWVEIYNPGGQDIDLEGWWIEDEAGTKTKLSGKIGKKDYFVIFSPRGKLNNGGDAVFLKDPSANLIDSMVYGGLVPAPDKQSSLGRDDGGTWLLTYGPTPGTQNEFAVPEGEGAEDTQDEEAAEADDEKKESSKTSTSAKTAKEPVYANTSFEETDNWQIDDEIIISGVVTAGPGIMGSQYFYMGDNQGHGAQVYNYKKEFPDLEIGDQIKVRGVLSKINEMWRVKTKTAEDIEVLGVEDAAAKAVVIEEVGLEYYAGYIEIAGHVLESKKSYLYLGDEGGEIQVRLKEDNVLQNVKLESGDEVRVRGILVGVKDGFRLEPRLEGDIEIMNQVSPVLQAEEVSKRSYNNLAGLIPLAILGVLGLANLRKLKKFVPKKK